MKSTACVTTFSLAESSLACLGDLQLDRVIKAATKNKIIFSFIFFSASAIIEHYSFKSSSFLGLGG